jgi:hypothetical protein
MQRTNIYMSDVQLDTLRRIADQRGVPVAELVRQAVDAWLEEQGVRVIDEDEWSKRFESLLTRRRAFAARHPISEETVERDVAATVREVRRARAAGRR